MRTLAIALVLARTLAAQYALGPDSQPREGVPQGKVTKYSWATSKIFPGTTRDYWVYVPAQYDGAKPACVMVFQDGAGFATATGAWRLPIVLDNLIQQGAMPVTIAVLIDPGVRPAAGPDQMARYNRSYEYDGLGDRYARFLIEEILPEVGKQYKLSADPNDRGISGSSSGGIAAFTAAWERPDAFRRVLSFIGSYTDLRGGDYYASLIRKMEPKPLRVFLQDGSNDLNIYSGSWWMANQSMAKSLEYAGYDMKFEPGTEAHNSRHGSAILPDALRWLWREYPKPIAAAKGGKQERHFITEILDPDHDWEPAPEGMPKRSAATSKGDVYTAETLSRSIARRDAKGKSTLVFSGTPVHQVLVNPDESLLVASQPSGRFIWSFHIQADGSLTDAEPFYHLETPDDGVAGGGAMAFDTLGHLYVTTRMGIQICDQPGRVVGIIRSPGGELSAVAFGGADMKTLYATAGGKVYKRVLRRQGAPAGQITKLPKPQL
jgi:enterochelin esterase-like enzyme